MIPQNKWRWLGHAQHFCAADNCRFHLATVVGKYVISTVGDYYPPLTASSKLTGSAADLKAGRRPERVRERIGAGEDSFFETFVFQVDTKAKKADCGCPELKSFCEVWGERAATAQEATRKHMGMCTRIAEGWTHSEEGS